MYWYLALGKVELLQQAVRKTECEYFRFEGNEKQSVAEIKEKSESFAKAEIYVGTLRKK